MIENTLNQFIMKLEGNEKKLVELLIERIKLLEEEINLKDEIIRQKNQQLLAKKLDLDYLYDVNRMLKMQNEHAKNLVPKEDDWLSDEQCMNFIRYGNINGPVDK